MCSISWLNFSWSHPSDFRFHSYQVGHQRFSFLSIQPVIQFNNHWLPNQFVFSFVLIEQIGLIKSHDQPTWIFSFIVCLFQKRNSKAESLLYAELTCTWFQFALGPLTVNPSSWSILQISHSNSGRRRHSSSHFTHHRHYRIWFVHLIFRFFYNSVLELL